MRPLLAIACLGILLSGCGITDRTVRHLGRTGTQGAIEGLVDRRAQVRTALRDVLLNDDLLQRIAERIAVGAIAGLSQEEQRARAAALATALTDALKERGNEVMRTYLRTAGAELEQTLQRVAADTLSRMDAGVKGLISQELTEATQLLIRKNAETLAQVLAKELGGALEGALGRSLQEASGQVARSVVREAALELRSKETQDAARDLLRAAMRDAVGGVREGLKDELGGSRTQAALVAGLIAMGSLLLLFAVGLLFFLRQYLKSATALSLIAQKINEAPEGGARLKAAISDSAQKNRVDSWLSQFLKRRGL